MVSVTVDGSTFELGHPGGEQVPIAGRDFEVQVSGGVEGVLKLVGGGDGADVWGTREYELTAGEAVVWRAARGPAVWPGTTAECYFVVEEKETSVEVVRSGTFEVPEAVVEDVQVRESGGGVGVMSFNVWYSGVNRVDGVVAIARVIAEQGPDLVGLQECSETCVASVAAVLKGEYEARYSSVRGLGVLVRKPLVIQEELQPQSDKCCGFGVLVQLEDGTAVRFVNTHLMAWPYGPYTLRDSAPVDKVLEQVDATQGRDVRVVDKELLDDGDGIVICVGDHNVPSHLDHGEAETTGDDDYLRARNPDCATEALREPVEWGVSEYLVKRGYVDAFREAHPNVLKEPGFTWTTKAGKEADENEVHDRIDFVYVKGEVEVRSAVLVEQVGVGEFPSDHRGVLVVITV